jgi:hypothetical protein
MDTLGPSHGCDTLPRDGAQTRCGQTAGNGVVAFGPLWKRVQVDVLAAGSSGFGAPCETCFPLPSPLQCPCCEREVTREQYDLACAELAKAARERTLEAP